MIRCLGRAKRNKMMQTRTYKYNNKMYDEFVYLLVSELVFNIILCVLHILLFLETFKITCRNLSHQLSPVLTRNMSVNALIVVVDARIAHL